MNELNNYETVIINLRPLLLLVIPYTYVWSGAGLEIDNESNLTEFPPYRNFNLLFPITV